MEWSHCVPPSLRLSRQEYWSGYHFPLQRMFLTQGSTWGLLYFRQFSSVQFSRSVVSDSLWPHGLQHARFPCPSPPPGAWSDSCSLSQWWYPTILSSVVPFSSCLLSSPASGSSPISRLFASGDQSIGASASVLPMNIQGWFPLGLAGSISLQVQGTLNSLLQHHSLKASVLQASAFYMVQLSHPNLTPGKTIALTTWTFGSKDHCLCFHFSNQLLFPQKRNDHPVTW